MASATVLCIDNNPQLFELRKTTLESRGYCVEVASSGDAAVNILKHAPVAAVLLDYALQGIDPEVVACHIKQQFPDVPIILLSDCPEVPERTLWLMDDYVMNGEFPEGLGRVIQRNARSHGTV